MHSRKNNNKKRGFGLIELLTSVAIITILSVAVTTNQRKFESVVSLSTVSQEAVLVIDQAQTYATSAVLGGNRETAYNVYGAYIPAPGANEVEKTIVIFAKADGNPGPYAQGDPIIEEYTLPRGFYIQSLYGTHLIDANIRNLEGGSIDNFDEGLSVVYVRPSSAPRFFAGSSSDSSTTQVLIRIGDTNNPQDTRDIILSSIGRVSSDSTITDPGLLSDPTYIEGELVSTPSSGGVGVDFTFRAYCTEGCEGGALTYSDVSCGLGGTPQSGPDGRGEFVCRYTSGGQKSAHVTLGRGGIAATTLTREVTVYTLSASLNATTGDPGFYTGSHITFTPTINPESTAPPGPLTYSQASCGIGETVQSGPDSSGVFTCQYSAPGRKTASLRVNRSGIIATAEGTVDILVRPTIVGSLSVSPTSGTTQVTYDVTASRASGTATGTITYTNPTCGPGGSVSNYSGSSDNTFSCTYSSAGSNKRIEMTVSQGGAVHTPAITVNVTAPTVTGSLSGSPSSGNIGAAFTFTPGSVGGTATGTISYSSAACGTGGTLTGGPNASGVFTCTYSSAGSKTASIRINRGGVFTTPTASVTVNNPTLSGSLSRSAASGNIGTAFTFTINRTGGTATGTITYSNQACGTGGTRSNVSGNTFRCTYSSAGNKSISASLSQGGVSASVSTTVSVATPTVTGSLSASPTSGITGTTSTGTTFTFTINRTGGTATGTISYSNQTCGTGGTRTNVSGNTFRCTYSSTGTKTVTARINQGGVNTTPSTTVSVATPTLTGSLSRTPTSGNIGTAFTFTINRTGGTATGTITYSNQACGTGGTRSNVSGNTFRCTYSSGGTKNVSAHLIQSGVSRAVSTTVSVANPTLTAVLNVNPTSGGNRNTLFTFTPGSVGGTATGTISYSSATCGTGGTLTGGPNASGVFQCRYSSTGSKTAAITLSRGGVTTRPTRTFTVSQVTITGGSLQQTNGQQNSEIHVAVNTSNVGGTATGTITFSNFACGTNGALLLSNTSTGAFRCRYSGGNSNPILSVRMNRQGVYRTVSRPGRVWCVISCSAILD